MKAHYRKGGSLISGNKVVCLLGGNKMLFTTKYKIGYSYSAVVSEGV